jgi:peptidoglycan/LPS O-acetylase OafA/YrhL
MPDSKVAIAFPAVAWVSMIALGDIHRDLIGSVPNLGYLTTAGFLLFPVAALVALTGRRRERSVAPLVLDAGVLGWSLMIWLGDLHSEFGHPRTIGLAFALLAGAVIALVGRLAPRRGSGKGKAKLQSQPSAALGMIS